MDIIKSILHVFKKSDNAFKIMHPETESAQITDWNQGIVNTLASTALGGLVNTLTSDSLLAKMIQKVLEATGVKYSLGPNGYVCFGSLVGGLIIQWGSNRYGWVAFPVAFAQFRRIVTNHQGVEWMRSQARESNTLNGFTLDVEDNNKKDCDAQWIAIGK
jgi:hypothetical protein